MSSEFNLVEGYLTKLKNTYDVSAFHVSNIGHHIDFFGPEAELSQPGCHSRKGDNNEEWPKDAIIMEQIREERYGLNCFAKTHFVRQNATPSATKQAKMQHWQKFPSIYSVVPAPRRCQPIHASDLIISQHEVFISSTKIVGLIAELMKLGSTTLEQR